jgi:hypothetical protein
MRTQNFEATLLLAAKGLLVGIERAFDRGLARCRFVRGQHILEDDTSRF